MSDDCCPACGAHLNCSPSRVTVPPGSLWNGPLEINPHGGYRPAPCSSAGSTYLVDEWGAAVRFVSEEEDVD